MGKIELEEIIISLSERSCDISYQNGLGTLHFDFDCPYFSTGKHYEAIRNRFLEADAIRFDFFGVTGIMLGSANINDVDESISEILFHHVIPTLTENGLEYTYCKEMIIQAMMKNKKIKN